MTAAVSYSCYGLTSTQDIDEMEAFFKSNPLPDGERAISQMLEVWVYKILSDCHERLSPSGCFHVTSCSEKTSDEQVYGRKSQVFGNQ